MRYYLYARAIFLDRAVLLLLVCLNLVVLSKLKLTRETFIGAINGSLAATLLVASLWRPDSYVMCRQAPIAVMRLLVCLLPVINNTVKPFSQGVSLEGQPDALPLAWQLGRGAFMLLVGVSWAVGLFIACLLLLPPGLHLAVQVAGLLPLLLSNNKSACRDFLAQTPGNAGMLEALDAALQAGVMSFAPAAGPELAVLRGASSQQATCMAAATALQVSLGLVLPTLLGWQLQSGMVAAITAEAQARRDSEMLARVLRSEHCALCSTVAAATQGVTSKLLLTLGSAYIAYVAMLGVLSR